jgi:hypothetical protein
MRRREFLKTGAVLAAGGAAAVRKPLNGAPPRTRAAAEGFEYAFNHIRRKDGVCVGIYARNAIDQIRQNATYTEMLTGT